LDGVIRVPNTFTRHELEAVFGEWPVRLDTYIQRGGDYVK
jgi:hypothetical protein